MSDVLARTQAELPLAQAGRVQRTDQPGRRIMLVGSTGLVGRAVMEHLVGRQDYYLTAIARREIRLPRGARMEMRLADISQWGAVIAEVQPEVLICALGTTWRKADKDEAAFRAVDHDLVLSVARAARDAGTRQFIFISSVGADRLGKAIYLRVKGETEDALAKLRFKRLDIMRPGLLRGDRLDDPRVAERLAQAISPITDLVLQGKYRRFRSIRASVVADAALGFAGEKALGRFFHEHDAIQRMARRFTG